MIIRKNYGNDYIIIMKLTGIEFNEYSQAH